MAAAACVVAAATTTKDGMPVFRTRDAVGPLFAPAQLRDKDVVRVSVRIEPSCMVFGSGHIQVQSMPVLVMFDAVAVPPLFSCFGDVNSTKHYVEGVTCFCKAWGHLLKRDVFCFDFKSRAVGDQLV